MTTMRWALIRNTTTFFSQSVIFLVHVYVSISIQDEEDIGIAPPTGRAAFSASAGILNDIPKNDQVSPPTKQLASNM